MKNMSILYNKMTYHSKQCKAINKNGIRCKCKTKKSPYCWIHLKYQKNLRIKPSNIQNAGFGLYAEKKIKKKEKIDQYKGKLYNRRKTGEYVLKLSNNKYIDAKHPNSCAGRYCNTCRRANKNANECRGNNAKFAIDNRRNKASIKATKNIKKGDEIFVPYGAGFKV